MLDISIIRDNPEKFDKALASRGAEAMSKQLLTLDEARRMAVSQAQELQTKRNETSKQIGQAKAAKDEGLATKLMDEVATMKEQLQIAVKLMPGDPIVNDHYGDVLWKNGNELQARYYWSYVLNLEKTEEDLKKIIEEKLIKGL